MDQKQESYSNLKEYEKQIKDEHNEQLIRYLAQVFLRSVLSSILT
jgi:hypothetical protein